jgi:hypothetical protein
LSRSASLSGNSIYSSPNATLDSIYRPIQMFSLLIVVRSKGNYDPGTMGRLTVLSNGSFQIHKDASDSQNWSGNNNDS